MAKNILTLHAPAAKKSLCPVCWRHLRAVGEACGNVVNTECGISQITDLIYETVCNHVSKPYESVLKPLRP